MKKDGVIPFPSGGETEPDIYEMDTAQLQAHYAAMQQELQKLDAQEPRDMNSDAYEAWADEHEELEDYLDEILDCLEEMIK